jgi:hypothetical protein
MLPVEINLAQKPTGFGRRETLHNGAQLVKEYL